MRKSLFFLLGLFIYANTFAQINTGSPALAFGKNSRYQYGIMPATLPTSGTYGTSSKAAEAYEAWKTAFVRTCGTDQYRVLFDDGSSTVSEGIAYGMLLSVYASDKALFDGLWKYYKANMNGNGIMNWKISGCTGVTGGNGATDAELDVAMALVIASEQWTSGSSQYLADAKSMIQKIKNLEMGNDGQTLNGDAWGNTNSCRNPSYFAPAYYTEFAKVDAANATFWNTTAINASNTILTKNRNATSGLVSNWCDNAGTENACGNTGSGAYGYGADACRNPWRMAVDYLWHGTSASTAAKDINGKLIAFVNGYENQLKGPLTDRSVSNPSGGSYINGSYTTLGLPTMTSSAAQGSLNKCYNAIAGLSNNDAYFNSTIRCISLFVLTGNFWAPGSTGLVYPPTILTAVTNGAGTEITLTANKALTASAVTASSFTLYLNGVAQTSGITSATISGTTITLSIATAAKPQPGQIVALSYSGTGGIKSIDNATMDAFTKIDVLNLLEGNETILDDCEDGNELNNVGGIWFSFDDTKDQNAACKKGTISTITPLSSAAKPLKMTAPGYNSSAYALNATYKLGANYTPYNNGSCASWTNPAFVGIGTWVDDVESNTMDWRSGTGVSFWYKGPACSFQVIIKEVTNYGFHSKAIPATADWTKYTVLWGDLDQPSWAKASPHVPVKFSAQNVQKLQWQFETGTSGKPEETGVIWIDDVRIMNMPPVALTSMAIGVKSTSVLTKPLELPKGSTDTLKLEITPTPTDASYPVVFWSSSDETVATVDYQGNVKAVGYGDAVITARAKMHQNVSATFAVKVPAPKVSPTAISFTPAAYSINVGETTTLIPSFTPITGVTETGLTWKSSNEAIATVSSSGVVTGVAAGGPVTITATSTATTTVKGTATVTVTAVLPTAIAVTIDPTSIATGATATATAAVTPDNAADKSVKWSSLDPSIATVNETTGVITGVSAGTATIVATSVAASTVKGTAKITVINSVNKKPLTDSIAAANTRLTTLKLSAGSGDGQYPTSALSAYETAIATATTALGTVASDAEVKSAVDALQLETVKVLAAKITVDRSALKTAIDDAKALKSTASNNQGSGNGQYPATAVTDYQTAIDAATTVYGKAGVTATEITAAIQALATATTKLNAAQVVVIYTALNDTITTASNILSTAKFTDGNGQYPVAQKAKITDAIAVAKLVSDNKTATQTQVDDAKNTLASVLSDFRASLITVDYTALTTAISNANTTNTAVKDLIGDGDGQYPSDKYTAFTSALTTAQTVAGTTNATAAAVKSATDALTAAQKALVDAKITVDKTALTDAISTANTLIGGATEGTSVGQYLAGSKATYQTAIDKATTASQSHITTQGVSDAVAELKKATDLFNASKVTTDPTNFTILINAIKDAKDALKVTIGDEPCQYKKADSVTLADVITTSQAMVDANTASQSAVNTQAGTLNAAVSAFKPNAEASKNNLNAAISNAPGTFVGKTCGTNPGQYSAQDSTAVQAAVAAAKTVAADKCATNAAVKNATDAIANAITKFNNSKVGAVNKDALQSAITTAKPKTETDASKIAATPAPGQYAKDKYDAMVAAYNTANTVLKNELATATDVKNATDALTSAVSAFDKSLVGAVYKSDLQAILAKSKAFIDSTTTKIGTNPGQYSQTAVNALSTQYATSDAVNKSTTALQPEIDTATVRLTRSYNAAVASRVGAVDKSALKSLITSTVIPTNVGTNPGQYTSASVAALQTAIDNAKTVRDNALATATEVQQAITAINSAVSGLKTVPTDPVVVKVDKTTLSKDAAIATELLKAPVGTRPTNYNVTTTVKATLVSVLAQANATITDATATQALVDMNDADLVAAIANYKASYIPALTALDKAVLATAIGRANGINVTAGTLPGQYSVEAYQAFEVALLNANKVYAQTDATMAEVNAAAAALDNARTTLLNSQIPLVNKTALASAIDKATTKLYDEVSGNVGIVPTQYSSTDSSKLAVAINSAQTVYNDPASTKDLVDATTKSLLATVAAIKPIASADKTVLKQTIISSESTLTGTVKGTAPGNYPATTYNALVTALNNARDVVNNPKATVAEVAAANTALTTAKRNFLNSQIPATDVEDFDGISVEINENYSGAAPVIKANGAEIISTTITSVSGVVYPTVSVNATETTVETATLTQGVYYVTVKLNKGNAKVLKFVK